MTISSVSDERRLLLREVERDRRDLLDRGLAVATRSHRRIAAEQQQAAAEVLHVLRHGLHLAREEVARGDVGEDDEVVGRELGEVGGDREAALHGDPVALVLERDAERVGLLLLLLEDEHHRGPAHAHERGGLVVVGARIELRVERAHVHVVAVEPRIGRLVLETDDVLAARDLGDERGDGARRRASPSTSTSTFCRSAASAPRRGSRRSRPRRRAWGRARRPRARRAAPAGPARSRRSEPPTPGRGPRRRARRRDWPHRRSAGRCAHRRPASTSSTARRMPDSRSEASRARVGSTAPPPSPLAWSGWESEALAPNFTTARRSSRSISSSAAVS